MTSLADRIRRDLTPFLDPGTILRVAEAERWLTAVWVSRGEERTADFSASAEGEILVRFEGYALSYRAFLSSPIMSDLLGLARMIRQKRELSFFVETEASVESSAEETSAIALLQSIVHPDRNDATNVLFVTGDAGAGKTEVLRHLVQIQADKYLKGEVDFLYLYVNAQGRALARLDEALATEIQDLRASRLTYHVVPTLTRCGVMVPLIDGFDELLGVLGYEDAFSSLRRFLEDLDGSGSLIASARSTYYQQEFVSRSGRAFASNQRIEVEQIAIRPWGEKQFRHFIDMRFKSYPMPSVSEEAFRDAMENVFSASENLPLKSKPFFVSKASELILTGQDLKKDSLIEQLVDGYVERERTQKLLDRNGTPLLNSDQIRKFVQMASEEMWIAETRVLDGETIRVLAELAFPPASDLGDSANIIRERAPTMAFFSAASGRDRIELSISCFFPSFLLILLPMI